MWEVFEQLRLAKGVSAYEVSRACGFGSSVLSSWKHGRYTPKDDKLRKIANYFGVPVEYLMTGDVQTLVPSDGYHLDEQSEGLIELVMKRPELREFIEEAADADPEDVRTALGILISLKRKGK